MKTTEVESSRTSLSSRTQFEVLGLGHEAPSPWPWPRSLKSSKIALSSARGQCGVSKGSVLRLRLTGSVALPRVRDDLLTYKAIGSNYLSFVVTSMLVFHIATG